MSISARYGVHAMELLINEIMKLGGDRRRLQAKVFGGAAILLGKSKSTSVGRRNVEFIRHFLHTEDIPIAAERLGGNNPLRVHFSTDTGKALVRVLENAKGVVERENRYSQQAAAQIETPPHPVTLF